MVFENAYTRIYYIICFGVFRNANHFATIVWLTLFSIVVVVIVVVVAISAAAEDATVILATVHVSSRAWVWKFVLSFPSFFPFIQYNVFSFVDFAFRLNGMNIGWDSLMNGNGMDATIFTSQRKFETSL